MAVLNMSVTNVASLDITDFCVVVFFAFLFHVTNYNNERKKNQFLFTFFKGLYNMQKIYTHYGLITFFKTYKIYFVVETLFLPFLVF